MPAATRPPTRRCRQVFDGFARVSHYLGAFGNGSRMKFVANLLVAVHNVAAAEAIVLGDEGRARPRAHPRGDRQRRRHLAHLRIARPDDGEGRLHAADRDDARAAEGQRDHRRVCPRRSASLRRCSMPPRRSDDEAEAQGYAERMSAPSTRFCARRAGRHCH